MYRIYNGSHVDQDLCTAMCAFDFPNAAGSKCGFVVLVGSEGSEVCYLGSLNNETNVLAAPVADADLQLKTCKSFPDMVPVLILRLYVVLIKYFSVVVVDETLRATWFKEFSTTDKSKEEFVYNVSSGIEYRGVQTRGDRGCLHFYWHTTMSCLLVLSVVTLVLATQQKNLKSFQMDTNLPLIA